MRNNYIELITKLSEKQQNYGRYRILGMDFGTKITGLASYDSNINICLPFGTIIENNYNSNENFSKKIEKVIQTIKNDCFDALVIGFPLDKQGIMGRTSLEILAFTDKLIEFTSIPVVHYDERFSTRLADRMLHDLPHLKRKKRNIIDNEVAATIILNDFIYIINKDI